MKFITFLLLSVYSIFLVSSCSIEKRKYSSGFYVNWKNSSPKRIINDSLLVEIDTSHQKSTITINNYSKEIPRKSSIESTIYASNDSYDIQINSNDFSEFESQIDTIKQCDIIHLSNGQLIMGHVEEISLTAVTYLKCNETESPLISINIKKVSKINYASGEIEDIAGNELYDHPFENNKKHLPIESYGVVSLFLSILGMTSPIVWISFGFLMFLMGIIFGIISLDKFKRSPRKYKGELLSLTAIILNMIGLITLFIFVVLL